MKDRYFRLNSAIVIKSCMTYNCAAETGLERVRPGEVLGATDVQSEQLALLKFTVGLSASVHTEAHGHFDLQREMSRNEGQ